MPGSAGNLLVAWTARLAIAAWGLRLTHDLARPSPSASLGICLLWTAGGLLNLLHVLAAFHYVHDWDVAAAWDHVARQTAAVTGWHWGGGLYVNYAFTLLWLADVAVTWQAYRRNRLLPRWYVGSLHAVFAFMVLNATVVFGPPVWRVVAPLFVATLVATWFVSRRTSRTPDPEPGPSGSDRPH
ncbi:hypothetical protein Mal4_01980 [Maioricimonas rarisocia]|uniref:Uncharacterized protein n=1 Tax=Maioricimonas rarisocia TaxID=2528026 RepID=A0A517Z0A9_9PLAN|nr:hypothetical protein [Maioricimonas rarisocia]QDU35916.1 hypothetical protein Mal4_01980 [Maioricimonas rarisocia]